MKPVSQEKATKNGYQSDDDTVRYKLNTEYFNKLSREAKKQEKIKPYSDEDLYLYKFPTSTSQTSLDKTKSKPSKIKVNFWSSKSSKKRLQKSENEKRNRRHTIGATPASSALSKPKNQVVKVLKRVSFLPSPLFLDNHIPMVTVPDDLTINLNEEEANDLREDLNSAFLNSQSNALDKRRSRKDSNETSPTGSKRRRSSPSYSERRTYPNENELEFFTKYVVQKLRRMETNQRIYSENLINTVLMLGQLGKLNGKSKVSDA